MRLLILGGTKFVGYFVARQALGAGWDVTVFNRGLAGQPPVGAEVIEGDRTAPADIGRLASAGEWDAVADCSGYVPANVLAVAEALAPVTDAYLFMSTVSVYRDWPVAPLDDTSETLFAPPDAGADMARTLRTVPPGTAIRRQAPRLPSKLCSVHSAQSSFAPALSSVRESTSAAFRGGSIARPAVAVSSCQPRLRG
jgi:NAD(P)-dependent dehydrogenase (short-subunit alcohol dehydrogenase family)